MEHVKANKCLFMTWEQLWKELRACGWKEVCLTATATEPHYCFEPADVPGEALVYGLTVFANQQSLIEFIHRFPYLLQDEVELTKTLLRHGWTEDEETRMWFRFKRL